METNIFYFLFNVNSESENDKKKIELYIFNIKKSFMSINTTENTNFLFLKKKKN